MLTEEAVRAAHYLRIDFEKGGIHIRPEKLDRVNQLSMDILQLSRQFNSNIITDPGHVDIFPASRVPKKLHHLSKPIYRPSLMASDRLMGENHSFKEKGFRLVTEPDALCSILQLASDSEVRKLVYIEGNSAPHANLEVLNKLLVARHEFSKIMGCKSYAEFSLKGNMASSPEVVLTFLNDISKLVRPKAEEEFKKISDFKRKKLQLIGDLEPWDEPYFTKMMKSSVHDLEYTTVASYFSLRQCIEGLKLLAESLFGVKCSGIPLGPGESWHPDVLKFSFSHPDEGDLGYLYLDLKSRRGKHPICAHFAIKGGRRVSETEYQVPVVALVCNFSESGFASVLLHHSDVETLFHEFGHALHSLLSRTDYQHFSGTRTVLDFAETPSNLFEYFAWDYRVLRTFAKHYSTGDPIPEKLVKSLRQAKNMFSATELQRQVFYAMIDQSLHTFQPSSARDTISLVANLKREHTCWKSVDGTHWHTRFSHLVTYGAGYYSYLYAKCFAATIWKEMFQEDPLSLAAGSALRSKLLQHGGAKDPHAMLNDLVGNVATRYQDGGIVPDITSLVEEMQLVN